MGDNPTSWFHRVLSVPDFQDETKKRTARVLKAILLALLAVAVSYSLIAPFVDPHPALALAANGSLSLLYVCLLWLIRRGWVELTSRLFLLALWLLITFSTILYGGINTPGVFNYFSGILLAGFLLGGWGGIGFAGLSALSSLGILYAQVNDYLPPPFFTITPFITWWLANINFLISAILLFFAHQNLSQALRQSHQNEQALAESHRHLQARTQALQEREAQLQAALGIARQQEAYLRSILNNMPFLMWLKDLEGRFLMVNEAAALFFSVPDTSWIIGKTDLDLTSPELAEQYRADDQEVIKTRSQKFVEEPIANLNGPRWFATYKTPILDEAGQVLGTTGFALDITERREAAQALKEYSERLEERVEERTRELQEAQEKLIRQEKLAFLGQLAGGVGHELRNPLGVITNAVYFLQLVLAEANDTVKEYLELITSRVQEAEKIVSDLLNLSRNRVADRREVTSQQLVDEVLARHPAPEGVTVVVDLAVELPPLFVDPQQIKQVLANLVSNAYQALSGGGQVTITAQAHPNGISLSIADTGPGMSPETMAKIFEPLFTTKAKGIGLGLAVSKNLVEINGGRIEVESREGQGSTFTVTLPTALV